MDLVKMKCHSSDIEISVKKLIQIKQFHVGYMFSIETSTFKTDFCILCPLTYINNFSSSNNTNHCSIPRDFIL